MNSADHSPSSQTATSPFKGDLIFPIAVSGVLIMGILACLGIIFKAESGLFYSGFDHWLLHLSFYLLSALSVVWMLILLCESFALHTGWLFRSLKWLLFFVYYPMGKISAFLFRASKQDYQNAFISFQNRLLLNHTPAGKISQILMLLPHCLQYHDCKIRITRDINDCTDCGNCDICRLKDLGKRFGIRIGIANGGTLARKLVRDNQPDYIIAVACHRDLTDGLRESWHYPVYAILNERPYGPCFDTTVDVSRVEAILSKLMPER